MNFALAELGKKVCEHDAASAYQRSLHLALSANNPHGFALLDWKAVDRQLETSAVNSLGTLMMDVANPDVEKYLATVKTDPALDKKYRSYALNPVRKTSTEWRMTAWCAAFVNWCLIQAGSTHLGYATAASWAKFGVQTVPTYGCVVVIRPSSDTGSTTGHVAFYGGSAGKKIFLLGGNQHRSVCWMRKDADQAVAFRWPATRGDFTQQKSGSAFV